MRLPSAWSVIGFTPVHGPKNKRITGFNGFILQFAVNFHRRKRHAPENRNIFLINSWWVTASRKDGRARGSLFERIEAEIGPSGSLYTNSDWVGPILVLFWSRYKEKKEREEERRTGRRKRYVVRFWSTYKERERREEERGATVMQCLVVIYWSRCYVPR